MKRSAVTVVKISFVRMGSAFQHVRSLPEIQETAAVLGRYRSQVFLVALSVIACQVPLPYIVSAVAGLGKNGSDGGGLRRNSDSFFQTPCLLGYWPVNMLARAGAQTGWLQNAERNITPWRAIASRFGVRFIGFKPIAPMQSQRNWSEMIRTILGRSAGGSAGAGTSAVAPTGTAFSRSLLVAACGPSLLFWLIFGLTTRSSEKNL